MSTAGHRPSFPIRSTSALELVGPFSAAGGVTVGLVSTIDVRHGKAVLAELRKAQRRQRTADFDVFEALYRVYITGLVAGVSLWLVSGVVGDSRVGPTTAARVAADGPQLVGCAVALALAVGLRGWGPGWAAGDRGGRCSPRSVGAGRPGDGAAGAGFASASLRCRSRVPGWGR